MQNMVRVWIPCCPYSVTDHSVTGKLPGSRKGDANRERRVLYAHPALQDKAIQWVRAHAKKSGKPNMKVKDFMNYVNDNLLRVSDTEGNALIDKPICWSAARNWLHMLGFRVHSHRKGKGRYACIYIHIYV